MRRPSARRSIYALAGFASWTRVFCCGIFSNLECSSVVLRQPERKDGFALTDRLSDAPPDR
eukprot:scaffold27057_cov23-Tisochrysis_lutea.AAC.1